MELKDEDIKKALVCCLIGECEGCPISKFSDCYETLKDEAMSLMNRQQAENEQLKRNLSQCENGYSQELHLARCKIEELKKLCTSKNAIIKELRDENERLENAIIALMNYLDILGANKTDTSFIKQATEINKQIRADIKSEAIKEFAERFIDEECAYCSSESDEMIFFKKRFDNFLAKRAGGENA